MPYSLKKSFSNMAFFFIFFKKDTNMAYFLNFILKKHQDDIFSKFYFF